MSSLETIIDGSTYVVVGSGIVKLTESMTLSFVPRESPPPKIKNNLKLTYITDKYITDKE